MLQYSYLSERYEMKSYYSGGSKFAEVLFCFKSSMNYYNYNFQIVLIMLL